MSRELPTLLSPILVITSPALMPGSLGGGILHHRFHQHALFHAQEFGELRLVCQPFAFRCRAGATA